MPAEYAQALIIAQRNGVAADDAVQRLIALLQRHGKLKALPAIVRELEHHVAQRAADAPTLTVATAAHASDARTQLALHFGDERASTVATATDDTLIGGWRYRDSDTLIDASYKHALITLYKRIVTT